MNWKDPADVIQYFMLAWIFFWIILTEIIMRGS